MLQQYADLADKIRFSNRSVVRRSCALRSTRTRRNGSNACGVRTVRRLARPNRPGERAPPKSLCLVPRYSALRIGDAASCAVDRLSGARLYMQKTGVPVYVPLPPFVVSALQACPRISERYWFWTGIGSKETIAGNRRRTFRRLCQIAGIRGGHRHRFRDTLAVELLLEGVPNERVSVLLGHSSVKVTERHYAPWVHARQAQLESDLARPWRNDPIAQMEMLRSDTNSRDSVSQRTAATNPRHDNSLLAN